MNEKDRLNLVEQEIQQAVEKAGRVRKDVTLIAVSKGQDFTSLRSVYALGIRDFGESYGQEMAEKMAQASKEGLNDIRWHFIGGIQSNKINVIKKASFIHSISSLKHAEILNNSTDQDSHVFMQINLDGAVGRQGFLPEEIEAAVSKINGLPHLKLEGLMTVLPLNPNVLPAVWFRMMVDLKTLILQKGLLANVALSMGMSDDFEEAIFYGANFIRIGTRIFGKR